MENFSLERDQHPYGKGCGQHHNMSHGSQLMWQDYDLIKSTNGFREAVY